MEILSKTKAGDTVRLLVDRDRHGVFQVYACIMAVDGAAEERCLCHGWGARKTQQGVDEGIIADGRLIEVSRKDWKTVAAAREALRNREHLEGIHLVRVFFQGARLTVDAYTLSAGVDGETWKKIESCMHFVDSDENDALIAGDRYVGWVVREGMEGEVEHLLEVEPERALFLKQAG